MASPLQRLITDSSRYLTCLRHYLQCCNENQSMQDFVKNLLPQILDSTVAGKSHLKVIGVGTGSGKNIILMTSSGEVDLQIFSMLHQKYPKVMVDNEVVEPNPQQLSDYKDLVSQTPGLDYITFNWNQMTAEEFEEHWKQKKMTKKVDFISMFQVLYFVKDRGATISFFQSLLEKNGKLVIILSSGDSSFVKLQQAFKSEICNINYVSTEDIKKYLDSRGMSYQSFKMPTQVDITDMFTEGEEKGELLLDFFTQVQHFSKAFPPELRSRVVEFLRQPDWTVESNGKVLLKTVYEVLVLDQLT